MAEVTLRPQAVHHVALQVRDLGAMERFYRERLRLPLLRRWPRADGAGDRSVWLDLGGAAFLALEVVPPGPAPTSLLEGVPGYHLLALRIEARDRGAWARALEAAGHPVYHATDFTIYVRDPEGNRVGLSHFPDRAPAPPEDADAVGRV